MTTDLATTLGRLEENLRRLERHTLLGALQKGITARDLSLALLQVGLSSNADLDALYGWRNGIGAEVNDTIDSLSIFPGFYPLSIESAISNYRAFIDDQRWTPGWLPILADGGGDFLVCDLLSSKGPVRHFRIDELEHPVEYGSLGGFLETSTAAYENGIIFVDPNGYLEIDDEEYARLAAKVNPLTAWWTE